MLSIRLRTHPHALPAQDSDWSPVDFSRDCDAVPLWTVQSAPGEILQEQVIAVFVERVPALSAELPGLRPRATSTLCLVATDLRVAVASEFY